MARCWNWRFLFLSRYDIIIPGQSSTRRPGMKRQELTGTAYSYIRFSSREQERGDSIRRQTEARDRWLANNPGVHLATEEVYSDLGVSAFRGKHRSGDQAKLGEFLSHV